MENRQNLISNLYMELSRFTRNGEIEKALKASNRILHTAPDEKKAFHCKVVCLMRLGQFSDALQNIKNKPLLSEPLVFETAYCYYRLNEPEEAFDVIKTVRGELEPRLQELKAQILYRREHYRECFDVYRKIIKNVQDDYEDERETNLAAVIVNLITESGEDKKLPKLRETTYELTYNNACRLIACAEYPAAEKKLRAAEKACRDTLQEDGASADEIESEVAIIKVQLAYCLQAQGREKESQALYASIMKTKPDDPALVAVAANNIVSINREKSFFDSKKKIKHALSDAIEHKLNSMQKRQIAINNMLFHYCSNQPVAPVAKNLVFRFPQTEYMVILISALELARDGKTAEAVKKLRDYYRRNTEHLLFLGLTGAQILLQEGDKKGAAEVLEELQENKYKPAIVSTIVNLYLLLGMDKDASRIFTECVEWYRKQGCSAGVNNIHREAAEFHIRRGRPDVAAASLEELLRSDSGNRKLTAQLVMAYVPLNPERALEISKQLPALTRLTEMDINNLESSNWIMGLKVTRTRPGAVGTDSPHTARTPKVQKAPCKRRKGKLPKNYDAGSTPDPERWLPKYERSNYRKRRDRRAKDVIKGSQGSAAGSAEPYDFSKSEMETKVLFHNTKMKNIDEESGVNVPQTEIKLEASRSGHLLRASHARTSIQVTDSSESVSGKSQSTSSGGNKGGNRNKKKKGGRR